ncbi:MAG: HAMP domain-containing sensor histidine kinase [Cyanobacteria bacterium J06632_3]
MMYAPSPSIKSSQQVPCINEIEAICRQQIERLGQKLPLLDAWLVCWNQLENRQDTFSYKEGKRALVDTQISAYLQSEQWLTENLPFLEIRQLATDSGNSNAYICGLGQTDTHWDYLLLWTKQTISLFQEEVVRDYARLLSQNLALYQENLRQRAKIQLLEEALQRADHQLRNPLALIRLYAETMYLGAESESQKYQADCIRQTADTISTSLSDLLYCGQQARLKREQHDLQKIVKAVIQLLLPRLREKRLQIRYPQQSAMLTVDCWQFQQVLQNILDNAAHFSPEGAAIVVDWRTFEQEVLISITDQGPGLQDVDPAQLFNPFYSQRDGGTGLGLAIAKKIILDHHGSIWAENLATGGAQFSIVLPRR